jgi:hypothetical protein
VAGGEKFVCIAETHRERAGLSWCGRRVAYEFHYRNLDHAAYDNLRGGSLQACPWCVFRAVSALVGEFKGVRRTPEE